MRAVIAVLCLGLGVAAQAEEKQLNIYSSQVS